MKRRNIIKIDEELCDGCGACLGPCTEGALVLEGGKVRVTREELCDGAGLCIGQCPQGALSLETKEAPPFVLQGIKIVDPGEEIGTENCMLCGIDDDKTYLLRIRKQGQWNWICTGCLPGIIHK